MIRLSAVALIPAAVATLAAVHPYPGPPASPKEHAVVALERTALTRWGHGDPQGYLELYSPDVAYFDPMQDRRIDGRAEMERLYGPIKGMVKVDSFEIIAPRVQEHANVALLTFNLASHGRQPNGTPFTVRWNSTEVYAKTRGKWQIIHSHWSFTKPGSMPAPPSP
jgi:ketosteroid isomerase-like protein